MGPFHCFIVNDVSGYICWQNGTTGFRIGWDNSDYRLFGSFCGSFSLSGRYFAFTLGSPEIYALGLDEPYS